MFQPNSCHFCGQCLVHCPFIDLSHEDARQEMRQLKENADSVYIKDNCNLCGYCDSICPTQSQPSSLFGDILRRFRKENGIPALKLVDERNPDNAFTLRLTLDTNEKQQEMKQYTQPKPAKEMFYVGCALSEEFDHLSESRLFGSMPIIGGVAYCCGIEYQKSYEDEQIVTKGREVLKKFSDLGVQKLVTFCPGCHFMLQTVYPALISDWRIKAQYYTDYVVDLLKHRHLFIGQPIGQKVTFHDPCPWRNQPSELYQSPREVLTLLGAEVVEMAHSHQRSLCCGVHAMKQSMFEFQGVRRLHEAENCGADMMVVSCMGCLKLSTLPTVSKLQTVHLLELILKVLEGRTYRRRQGDIEILNRRFEKLLEDSPHILRKRLIVQNGQLKRLEI